MSDSSTNVSRTSGSRRSTYVAITAAIIGIIYGYDLGNISGALLFIPQEFHLSTFQTESVPAAVRGRLIVMYQLATVAGIMIAYFIDYGLALGGLWRIMLGLAAVPAIVVGFMLLPLPDTPRWYVMKGKHEQALETLRQIEPEADKELLQLEEDLKSERGGKVSDMLRSPFAKATFFVVILGFLVQITGINAVVFYSPLIFKSIGFQGNFALLILPGIVQIASFFAVIGSLSIVDRWGRRPTLLTGIGVMILSGILMAIIFSVGTFTGTLAFLFFVGFLFFTAAFNFGFGSMVWVYASESFPAQLRTIGASTMLTADLVANVIIAAFFLSALTSLGGVVTFITLVVFAVIAWLFVWWLAPETKGRPLEAIRSYWENGGKWPAA